MRALSIAECDPVPLEAWAADWPPAKKDESADFDAWLREIISDFVEEVELPYEQHV